MAQICLKITDELDALLRRRAEVAHCSLSQLAQQLLAQGLKETPTHPITVSQTTLQKEESPSTIEQLQLKTVFETLMLVRHLIPVEDESLICEATEEAKNLLKQFLEKEKTRCQTTPSLD